MARRLVLGRTLSARVYGTTAEIFPDMAYDVMLEASWEKIAKRIVEWLGTKGI